MKALAYEIKGCKRQITHILNKDGLFMNKEHEVIASDYYRYYKAFAESNVVRRKDQLDTAKGRPCRSVPGISYSACRKYRR